MRPDLRLAPGVDLQDWLILESRHSSELCDCWKARNLLTYDLAEMRVYNPEFVTLPMIARETQLLEQLRLPVFPRLVGQFPYRGTHIVLTSYIEGSSLAELIDSTRVLPFHLAENAGRDLLKAMQHLHALPGNFVHRSVHPGNILFDEAMNLTLSGLAFVESAADILQSPSLNYVRGDARYEAPETFANPAAITVLSNVYSCGAILFELFAGRRAFDSEQRTADLWYQEIAYLHQNLPAPLISDYNAAVPYRISNAINQALSKQPSQRPASCAQLAAQISGIMTPPPLSASATADPPLPASGAAPGRKLFGWFGTRS